MLLLGTVASFGARAAELVVPQRWVVFYGSQADSAVLAGYDWIVLDSDAHPPIKPLLDRGKIVFGYLSLCEIGDYRSYFSRAKTQQLLLHTNSTWPGSYVLDIRDPKWSAMLVEDIIPHIAAQGFSGLFLDTLDQAAHLERSDPKRYQGMREAAVKIVRLLRKSYPELRLLVNRGYDLFGDIAGVVDAVVGESVYATYNFERKQYQLVDTASYRQQLQILNGVKRPGSSAPIVLTLDYWNPADVDGLSQIYAAQRRNGFVPYVATIELNAIVAEPPPRQ